MTRSEKTQAIELLKNKFENNSIFYLADSSTLTVEQINKLRRMCFEKGVEMHVVKNTLAVKALENAPDEKGYEPLFDHFKGHTSIFFADTANVPAKLIGDYRKKGQRPILKAAYIDSEVYIGDDQLSVLANLKSKEELVGDIIMLLQSPIQTVLGSLQSGGQTLMGVLKTLEERGES